MSQSTFTRVDRNVLLTVVATLALTALFIWRGDQLGLQPVAFSPAEAANGVPLRLPLTIRFDQALDAGSAQTALTFAPPVSGTVQVTGNELTFTPATALAPATAYQVTLSPELFSQQGRRLREAVIWRFRTGQISILYTATGSTGVDQLFTTAVTLEPPVESASLAAPTQLSLEPTGIWDFAVSPDGRTIIYSALKEDGTSDLWRIDTTGAPAETLLACPDTVCNGVAWAPDNQLIAYSKRNAGGDAPGVVSPPRLWIMNVATGENSPLFADDQKLAFDPRWSPDGEWLSYLSPDLGGVGVINMFDGRTQFYESTTGEAGQWQPRTNRLLMNVMRQVGEQHVVHLLTIDPQTNEQWLLSGEENLVEDGAALWSPDGERIAFGRKVLTGDQATLGRQLWLMWPDGSAARPLTNDPGVDHSQAVWSPDGRYLLFHKLPLKGPEIVLSIWVLKVSSGQQWEVARPGQRPQWLP